MDNEPDKKSKPVFFINSLILALGTISMPVLSFLISKIISLADYFKTGKTPSHALDIPARSVTLAEFLKIEFFALYPFELAGLIIITILWIPLVLMLFLVWFFMRKHFGKAKKAAGIKVKTVDIILFSLYLLLLIFFIVRFL